MAAHLTRRHRAALVGIVMAGAALRLWGIDDPLATRWDACWREADLGTIARAFHREDLNPLHPRVAWRGDGPGLVEGEFQFVPFVTALLYRLTGESDVVARTLVAFIGITALLVFVRLALRVLPRGGALVASLAFALNPLLVFLGTSVQPDPLMVLFLLLAFSALERWYSADKPSGLYWAGAWVGLAILAKAPAAHFGLVLAFAILVKLGARAFLDRRVWLAGALALLPGVLWYAHAKGYWIQYRNSLGVSNEQHTAGLDLFTTPRFVVGIMWRQVIHVFTASGAVLAVLALRRGARTPVVTLAGVWAGAALLLYLIAARTAADTWAFYYHASSVAPAALLIGAGVSSIQRVLPDFRLWRALQAAGVAVALAAGGAVIATTGTPRLVAAGVGLAVTASVIASLTVRPVRTPGPRPPLRERVRATLLAAALPVLLALTLAHLSAISVKRALVRDRGGELERTRACAQQLAEEVPPDAKIVVDGGRSLDDDGLPIAHDRAMLFYFMDRHGYTVASESLTVEALKELNARGGRYFLANRRALETKPDIARAVRTNDAVVDVCETHALVDLNALRPRL